MLKCDFHMHTKEDPAHYEMIGYTAKDLIDHAAKLKYDVLSITNHFSVLYDKKLADYAKSKGILLIPGAEIQIEKKDVLVYGVSNADIKKIKTFKDLKKVPLAIAPHPFHVLGASLGQKFVDNIDCFDAVEYSHFYLKHFNPNIHSLRLAMKHNLPIVGTSDAHTLPQFGTTYSLIEGKKTMKGVFSAIKNHHVKVNTRPLSVFECIRAYAHIQRDAMRIRSRYRKGLVTHKQGDPLEVLH